MIIESWKQLSSLVERRDDLFGPCHWLRPGCRGRPEVKAEIIVNVQGDEPLLKGDIIDKAIDPS